MKKKDNCPSDPDSGKDNAIIQTEKDMLSKLIVGGLLGAYLEEGFPLYYISDIMLSYLGFLSKQEFADTCDGLIANQIHPDDRQAVWQSVNEQISSGEEYVVEYRYRRKDGSYLWVHDAGKRVIAENGKPATTSICYDITEQKKLQQRLEETSREMQTIVDNIPGGVVKMSMMDGKLLPEYMSVQFCVMMNDTRENMMELYRYNSLAGLHPDDFDCVSKIVADGMTNEKSFNATYRISNSRGEYHWVTNHASRVIDQSGQICYYSIYTDVDKEIRARQAAEKSAREIELLYNTIPGAVFKCRFNADWDVIFANDGLFRFLGYTREEFRTLLHNKMSSVIYPDDGEIMVEKISAQLEHGTTVKNENRLICKDGSIKWISIHAELLTDETGEKYFYCTFVDITEQKQAELAFSQTQEKLSAAIAHAGLAYWEYDILNQAAYLNKISVSEYKLEEVLENYPQSLFDSGSILPESIGEYQRLVDAVRAGNPSAMGDIKTMDANGKTVWKRVRFTTMFNEKKQPFWAVATAETIDEFKSLEQQFASQRRRPASNPGSTT